jgi:hypothetical protein
MVMERPSHKDKTQTKTKYHGEIFYDGIDYEYNTWATDEGKAINNFIYRLSEEVDEPVGLLHWKRKNGDIDIDIEEL